MKRKPIVTYEEEFQNIMSHFIMTQYSLKKGLKKLPKKGADGFIEDMAHLHNREAMEPLAYG